MISMRKTGLWVIVLFIHSAASAASLVFSPPQPKVGEVVTLTLRSAKAIAGAVTWDFGDNSPRQAGQALAVTHVYAAAGAFTVKASYSLASGAPMAEQAVVRVSAAASTIAPRVTQPANPVVLPSPRKAAPPDIKPSPNKSQTLASSDAFKELLNNTPRIEGMVDCTSWKNSGVFLSGYVSISLHGKPVTGAKVTVNQLTLPEYPSIPGYYDNGGSDPIQFAPGQTLIMVVRIGNDVYTGKAVPDNGVILIQPENGSVVHLKSQSQVDFKWKFINGSIEPVTLWITSHSPNINYSVFKKVVTADHISVPAADFSPAAGSERCAFLSLQRTWKFAFDGMAAFTAKVGLCWGQAQSSQVCLSIQDD